MSTDKRNCRLCGSRRDFLSAALGALGTGATLPLFLRETNLAFAADALAGAENSRPNRILVVLELSGGNDGLNTVVPHANDEYYRVRPTLAIDKNQVLKLNDEFGLHPNLLGWERLFKDGHMAIVHGCGYPNPNRSHFESMRFWHTGVPNAPEKYGWVGRFADANDPQATSSYLVNLAAEQSQAVVSDKHSAVVFDDPKRFIRDGSDEQAKLFRELARRRETGGNASLDFVRSIAATADQSSQFIRNACAEYRSKADYGYGPVGVTLRQIVAQINAASPARIYYTAFGNFDTHASQAGAQSGLFNQVGDAVHAFYYDLERIGRVDDVALMMFTEFGRRVKENASFGTDHGVAGPMFVVGKHVKGGFYGQHSSLTELDDGDLKMTTDFRSVYATMIKEWMGFDDTNSVLKGDYPTLGVFG
jgi:uncharacterized protein (DUF1501 family)